MEKAMTLLTIIPLLLGNGGNPNTIMNSVKEQARSHYSHPNIPGFEYSYGNTQPNLVKASVGYFYYDNDVYFSPFTENSRLYIIHIGCNFTPGKLATTNKEEGFDVHYGLWNGFIHIKAYPYQNGSKKSSSYHYLSSWPESRSNSMTATIISSFGTKIDFSSSIKAGADLTGGAEISQVNQRGFSLDFSKSISITNSEPMISHQLSDQDYRQSQWNYQFTKGLYNSSYAMDCYYMFELKNDGQGYRSYSFKYDVERERNNVAWEGFLWQQTHDVSKTVNDSYGLY